MMDKLERRIFNGCVHAQQTYKNMTGGWWLWHGPESFIQHEVARAIRRSDGFEAYAEASPRKIMRDHDRPLRGRPPKNDRMRQRFDVVVWRKTKNEIRAIIEIKRGSNATANQIAKDAKKVSKYLALKNSNGIGYLLFYSEASGKGYKKS